MRFCTFQEVNYHLHITKGPVMGQTLSEPVTTKETSAESNEHMKVGTSAMQGWRINILFMLVSITEAIYVGYKQEMYANLKRNQLV